VRKVQVVRPAEKLATPRFSFVPFAEMDECVRELAEDERLPAAISAHAGQAEGLVEDRSGLAESRVLDGKTREVELSTQRSGREVVGRCHPIRLAEQGLGLVWPLPSHHRLRRERLGEHLGEAKRLSHVEGDLDRLLRALALAGEV